MFRYRFFYLKCALINQMLAYEKYYYVEMIGSVLGGGIVGENGIY